MSKISKEKEAKIMSDIISVLYENSPKPLFTSEISEKLTRDEEFIKRLLLGLESQKLIVSVDKNSNGIPYSRRLRWRLSTKAYEAYDMIEKQKINYDDKSHTYH